MFWDRKKIFWKKAHICLYLKEAKLSTFEWCWWLSIWEHNEIFCYYLLIFWQNISLCSQISAVSTIQLGLNLASLKYKQMWAFYQNICFSARKRPLEALTRRNRSCQSVWLCILLGQTMLFDHSNQHQQGCGYIQQLAPVCAGVLFFLTVSKFFFLLSTKAFLLVESLPAPTGNLPYKKFA